jgi:GDP-4-dehydro-6-deoxy-D-mannose reductase
MPQRALITGISGFIGGHLAEHLLASGDAVLGCTSRGAWRRDSPAAVAQRVELAAFDIARDDGLAADARRAIERFRPTCIYHLAALSVPQDCGEAEPSPAATAVNVDGTRRVLELAAGLPSRPRLLFVSSSHVYAPVLPAASRVAETAPLGPDRGYGRSKLAAENVVRRAGCDYGADAVIVRAFQNAGPRMDARLMLSQWSRQFLAGGSRPVEVYTRDAHIDLSDVRDVVRAYRLVAECGRAGEIYNVGSGTSRTSGAIFDLLRRLAGPGRAVVETRPGFKQGPIADISRLAARTGWAPAIPIEQTVADTWAWWQAQGLAAGD